MKNLLLISVITALIGISASSLEEYLQYDFAWEHNTSEVRFADPIMLPLEIMGKDGTTVSVHVGVDNVSKVDRMYIKAHSISYPAYQGYGTHKASMRLNGGKWMDVNNKTVDCVYPEKEYGCTEGPYATIRFWIRIKELGKLKNGENEIEFRFNYVEGNVSSGYRILELDLFNKGGYSAIQDTEIAYEDPTAWAPAIDDSIRLENGGRLYESRNVLYDYPGGKPIRASCKDCHANNGRDLKYFNYSDHSIVTRSTFHGLTEQQGNEIAAWVRSQRLLDEEGTEFVAPGRPWNPPYQPGPGLDDQPVYNWAGGAGLEWVLDHDANSYSYLVTDRLEDVIKIDSTLNRRELPLSLQLADWNEWLPHVHPMDVWQQVFESSRAQKNYENVIDYHITHPEVSFVLVDELKVVPVVEKFSVDVKDFARHEAGISMPDELNSEDREVAVSSLFRWHLVKLWDFMHTNHYEGITTELYPQGEERGWFGMAQNFASMSPHSYADGDTYLDELSEAYFNTSWHELQVIMNSGHRETVVGNPVDWAQHFRHIQEWKNVTDISHGTRYVAGYIKVLQNANNRHGVKMPDGFYLGHTTLAWVHELGMPDSRQNVLFEFELLDPDLRKKLAEAFVSEVLKKLKRHDYNEWDRSLGQSGIGPATYVPTSARGKQKKTFSFDKPEYADHFYRIIPIYRDLGVDTILLQELAQWGRGAWPQGDWDAVMKEN